MFTAHRTTICTCCHNCRKHWSSSSSLILPIKCWPLNSIKFSIVCRNRAPAVCQLSFRLLFQRIHIGAGCTANANRSAYRHRASSLSAHVISFWLNFIQFIIIVIIMNGIRGQLSWYIVVVFTCNAKYLVPTIYIFNMCNAVINKIKKLRKMHGNWMSVCSYRLMCAAAWCEWRVRTIHSPHIAHTHTLVLVAYELPFDIIFIFARIKK